MGIVGQKPDLATCCYFMIKFYQILNGETAGSVLFLPQVLFNTIQHYGEVSPHFCIVPFRTCLSFCFFTGTIKFSI